MCRKIASIKMPNCCVVGCKSKRFSGLKGKEQVEYKNLHSKISFHRFPKNIQQRKLWLDRIGILCHNVTTNSCVCSLHFDEFDLDRTSLSYVRLRENALPKISSTDASSSFDHDYTRKRPLQEIKENSLIKDTNEGREEPLAKHRKENLEQSNIFEEKFEEIEVPSEQASITTTPKRATIGTSTSPMLSENTPRKVFLKTALENTKQEYTHKIKILQQKLRRQDKRIAQMHSILTTLRQKNLINVEQLDVLEINDRKR